MALPRYINMNELIEQIRSQPCLWDIRDKHYKDVQFKTTTWTAIARQFNITKVEAQTKWRSTRDRYMKERRALNSKRKSGSVDGQESKWRHYDYLSEFLDPTLESRSAMGNDNVEMQDQSSIDLGTTTFVDEDTLANGDEPIDDSQSATGTCRMQSREASRNEGPYPRERQRVSRAVKRSQRDDSVGSNLTSLIREATSYLKRLQESRDQAGENEVRDEAYFFFGFATERYRHLNTRQKRYVRQKMEEAFTVAEDMYNDLSTA